MPAGGGWRANSKKKKRSIGENETKEGLKRGPLPERAQQKKEKEREREGYLWVKDTSCRSDPIRSEGSA